MQDFEGRVSLTKWPKDTAGDVARTTEWAADGASSLRIDPGLLASTDSLYRHDFRGADALRVHVHNPSDKLVTVGFELQDDHATLYDRHRSAFGAPPGDSTIDIDISGDLWRGEENRPFRGPTKTPLDLGHITRIGFENRGDKPIYVDALTLVMDPFEAPPNAFAFDFGRRGTRVMAKTKGVFEDTMYTDDTGFGFVPGTGKPTFLKSAATYPSPLLGDGLAWEDAQFAVNLPGGKYLGWIAFERAGFWEADDEATGYFEASLSVNGAEAHRHPFDRSGPHFFFEDVEVTKMEDAWDKLVRPACAIAHFSFEAKPGRNTFSVAAKHPRGPSLRVAGMFLAPDTPAGLGFIDAMEQRQKEAFERAFPKTERARRPEGGPPITNKLLVSRRPLGDIAHPRDLPDKAPTDSISVTGVAGHPVLLQFELFAPQDVEVMVHADDKASATLVEHPTMMMGVYGPKRPYEGGAAWIETAYYRPTPIEKMHVGPDLARSVLLQFDVAKDAPPGVNEYRLRFRSPTETLAEADLRIEIVATPLPPLPIPVGLFMNALPYGPDAMKEDQWWTWQEGLIAAEAEAGLNTPTGGPGLYYTVTKSGDGYAFSGDRALKYLEIAQRYGMTRAVVGYTGFLPSIKHERPDAAAFQKSWAEFEKAHELPPHYLYSYDEPSTDEELSEAASYLGPFQAAGARTIGFFSSAAEARFRKVIDATFAPAVSAHTPDLLRGWVAEGKHVFLYNRGVSRLAMGADLVSQIKLGVAGRLEWIGLYTQGFAFDDLDGREPSYGMFVAHDRYGVLPTPRWLSMREGLIDARVRLALEKAPPPEQPLPPFPAEYPADPTKWTDEALDTWRAAALRHLQHTLSTPPTH
ncbi:MAG: hypothetical protein U0441_38390 [Polyangiaceae bacterium]